MTVNIGPEIVLTREKRFTRRAFFGFLAAAVALTTVVLLINPATTQEYSPVCGIEAHVHGPECYETVRECICPLEESVPHTHTEECYQTSVVYICGLEDDPEHVHTEECEEVVRTLICGLEEREEHVHTEDCIERELVLVCDNTDPEHEHTEECYREEIRFVCKEAVLESGMAHVHGDLCYAERQELICDMPEHTHTDECYPKLTGDPHEDVEIDLDWESTFCDVEKTGIWAEDLVSIARSQIGYAESELNFVTDDYNVRHGYTRYGDWYGNRYAGWNALYVMFCLHYADVWGIPTDSVPANWMNAARAQGFWTEADGEPVPGDLVFFDDNADFLADRVAIVTAVYEDEIDVIIGGTGVEVHEEIFPRYTDRIAGYLALPTNPDYVALEASETQADPEADPAGAGTDTLLEPYAGLGAALPDDGTKAFADPYVPVTLTAETEDGVTATLSALSAAFPYPAEELTLTVREVGADDPEFASGIWALNDSIAEDGGKVLGARYLDISVWHTEPAEPETADAESADAEAFGAADIEALPEDEFLPTDEVPEEQALIGEAPAAETKLVEIQPEGAVEITVEGLWGEGTVKVFRIGEDSAAQELSASPDPATHRITVTTGLN